MNVTIVKQNKASRDIKKSMWSTHYFHALLLRVTQLIILLEGVAFLFNIKHMLTI